MPLPGQPLDSNYKQVTNDLYDTVGKQFVSALAGTVVTSSDGTPYAPTVVQQVAPATLSATLQNAAALTGNGTAFSILGDGTVMLTITQTGFSGTVLFQGSEDGTNYSNLLATQMGTSTVATGITSTTVTSTTLYEISASGLQSILTPITRSAGTITITAHAVTGTFSARVICPTPYPATAIPITATSGNVAAATATATLAAIAGKTTYITGFAVTGTGATTALPVSVTVTGVVSGTMTYTYAAIAGVLLANTPLIVPFPEPIPASATNTAIVVSCPTLGPGNTNNTANAYGFQL